MSNKIRRVNMSVGDDSSMHMIFNRAIYRRKNVKHTIKSIHLISVFRLSGQTSIRCRYITTVQYVKVTPRPRWYRLQHNQHIYRRICLYLQI